MCRILEFISVQKHSTYASGGILRQESLQREMTQTINLHTHKKKCKFEKCKCKTLNTQGLNVVVSP